MKKIITLGAVVGIFCLSLCAFGSQSQSGALFDVSLVNNVLVISAVNAHQNYPVVGIKLNTPHYSLLDSTGQCQANPNTGYCIFALNQSVVRKAITLNAVPHEISITLCANGDAPATCRLYKIHDTYQAGSDGRLIGYLAGWETPPPVADLVNVGYSNVIVTFAVFSQSSGVPGSICSNSPCPAGSLVPANTAVDASYVQALRNAGIKVSYSIGGASTNIPDTTVNFNDAVNYAGGSIPFKAALLDSLSVLANQYDGFDFDIEQGFITSGTFTNPTGNIAILADVINTMHTNHPTLEISLVPQIANISATSGFNETFGNYSSLIMQTYDSLAWVGIQLYNSGCAFGINLVCYDPNTSTTTPDPAVAFAVDLLTSWPANLPSGQPTGFQPYVSNLHPPQVVLGYPALNSSGSSDGSPAGVPSVILRAIQCLSTGVSSPSSCDTYVPLASFPELGGVFEWDINYDATNNYQFAKQMYPCAVLRICN